MNSSVLVTRRIFPEAIQYLQRHCDVDYEATDDGLTPDQLLSRAAGKQAIVSQLTDKLPREVMAQLRGVRILANVAVGFDNIDVPAATELGIMVTNTPDVLTDSTADFAFALLLAAARRVVEGHLYVHAGKWKRWSIDLLAGHDIHHRTIGIVGMGRIGRAVARRALGFSMRILYHDAQPVEGADGDFVPLDHLLEESDFVTLHTPLSAATRHLIGERELRLMKPAAILINTSRGPVVDEAVLARALEEKWIAYAGLDVFESEPEIHPALLKLENVVLAPHIASASIATRRGMSMLAAENAVAALEGRRPPNLLNPDAWGSATSLTGV